MVEAIKTSLLHDIRFRGLIDGSIKQNSEEFLDLKSKQLHQQLLMLKKELEMSHDKMSKKLIAQAIDETYTECYKTNEAIGAFYSDDDSDNSCNGLECLKTSQRHGSDASDSD